MKALLAEQLIAFMVKLLQSVRLYVSTCCTAACYDAGYRLADTAPSLLRFR